MDKFYISRVVASGSGQTDSIIDLKPGLNIIQGRSNTGKTCIIKCIDYCFGGKAAPFDKSLGYDTVGISLHTIRGNISITRKLGKNQVEVITEVQGFEDGTYDIKHSNKKNPRPVLSDLLLKSIGIDGEHQIVKNVHFEKKRLTWRTFLHVLLFHVTDIAKETSILEPEQATAKTALFSALLFLLSGKEFEQADAQTKKDIRVARKSAVEEYVNKKIKAAADKKKDLNETLAKFDGIDVEAEMRTILDSLQTAENQISDALKESREISGKIIQLQNRSVECDLLKSRYAALKSQYVSDIKRLSFIVNGEVELQHVPKITVCPFCDGKMPVRDNKSYIESAQAELDRITVQMTGLSETEQDIKTEQADIEKELTTLLEKKTEIERMVEQELQPKASALRESLETYRIYIQTKKEMQVIDDFASGWEEDLRELPSEDENQLEYHPKEYFDSSFQEQMDKMLKEALIECAYDNLTTARFNMKDFDIEVNGQKKANANGQGYCSYLNSIVALVFRRYLNEYAKYDPGFVVIDTPLLGLDQGVEDYAPESMRTALFQYFMNHQEDGQIIILENMRHIPKLDYAASGANVITFTKGLEVGRYGFLNGVQ